MASTTRGRTITRTTLAQIEADLEERAPLAQLRRNLQVLRGAAWSFPQHASQLAGLTRARLEAETPAGEDWEIGPQP